MNSRGEESIMITIKNVSKSLEKVEFYKNINLTINKSNVIGLIGPSGAGKSTLIRTINALEEIDQGDIIIEDISIHQKRTDMNRLRTHIGFAFKVLTYIHF